MTSLNPQNDSSGKVSTLAVEAIVSADVDTSIEVGVVSVEAEPVVSIDVDCSPCVLIAGVSEGLEDSIEGISAPELVKPSSIAFELDKSLIEDVWVEVVISLNVLVTAVSI